MSNCIYTMPSTFTTIMIEDRPAKAGFMEFLCMEAAANPWTPTKESGRLSARLTRKANWFKALEDKPEFVIGYCKKAGDINVGDRVYKLGDYFDGTFGEYSLDRKPDYIIAGRGKRAWRAVPYTPELAKELDEMIA